jgi:hypothetical protein
VTRVLGVDQALQPTIRKASEASLARKVLVCEGKTELGLCRRLDEWWAEGGRSFGLAGVAMADGGGTQAAMVAKAFTDMGYDVALLGDSDKPLTPDQTVLEAVGIKVILWGEGMALEQRIANDLPWEGLAAIVEMAMDFFGEEAVRSAIACRMNICGSDLKDNPLAWRNLDYGEVNIRTAIGEAALKHKVGSRTGWFKRVDRAEELAGILIAHFDALAEKDLGCKIRALREWAHRDE